MAKPTGGVALTLAFAFTVMADPVSSVAYAIEAALRGLHGNLSSLLPAMAAVIAIIAVISATYHYLIGRFPLPPHTLLLTHRAPVHAHQA